jgi:hypothetical protein
MNPMDNDVNNLIGSLANTAGQMSDFLTNIQKKLTPEQKELLDKELGGDGKFNSEMKKTQKELTKVLKDLNNFGK